MTTALLNSRFMGQKKENTLPKEKVAGRAADFVVSQIEARILSDELADGETLPAERDLMARYGVSRTVIREAITRLAGKGLIIAKPRHRPVVQKVTYDSAMDAIGGMIEHLLEQPNGVRNLFETRIMIESALVREAALCADKSDIRALRDALNENEAAIPSSKQFYATDIAFHAVLYRISNNPVLPVIHKAYTSWLSGYWKKMPRLPDRNRMNFHAHQAIFNAILNRDPDEAEAALRSHLDMAWEHVKVTFDWQDD